MEAEASQLEEDTASFCVSAPSKRRVTTLATSAASVHLASLVKKARDAALPPEGLAAMSAYLGKVNLMRRSQRNAGGIGAMGHGGVVGGRVGGAFVRAGKKVQSGGKAGEDEEEEESSTGGSEGSGGD